MPAASPAPIEVTEGQVLKALSIAAIRYDTFGKLILTFDRRYERSIQLSPRDLAEHIRHCTEVLNCLQES